ncbi:hypothetical protein BaRGS_00026395, partial [Batillaria attramentaria]
TDGPQASAKAAYGITPVRHLTQCKGDNAVLYTPSAPVKSVYVYRGWDTLASTSVPATGLQKNLRPEDIGLYVTEAVLEDDAKYLNLTAIYLTEPPVTEEGTMGRLHVQQVSLPGNQDTVRLTCGRFISLGFPPADVIWQDPEGRVLGSTGQADGVFHVDLPPGSPSGNYSCKLDCGTSRNCCMPPHSPLLRRAHAHVDTGVTTVETSASLVDVSENMAAGMAALVNEQLQANMETNEEKLGKWKQKLEQEVSQTVHEYLLSLERRQNETEEIWNEAIEQKFKTMDQALQTHIKKTEKQMDDNISSLNQKFDDLAESIHQNLEELKTQIKTKKTENETQLQEKFAELTAQLTENIQQNLGTAEQNLTTWKSQHEKAIEDLGQLLEEQLDDHLNQLSKTSSRLQERFEELEKESEAVISERVAKAGSELEEKFGNRLSDIQAAVYSIRANTERKAAFRAVLNHPEVIANLPIPFTGHVEDLGGGYTPDTGIYTTPFSGWFTFHAQIFPHFSTNVDSRIDLYRNEEIVARGYCYQGKPGSSYTCSTGLTMHLRAGDRVWVQSLYGHQFWYAPMDNIFSGFMVTPDD